MLEMIPLSVYKAQVWTRLEELSKLDIPQFRTYRNSDGTWTDREPVPEYIEREELCRICLEIRAYENWFSRCHNKLLISLRLNELCDELQEYPPQADRDLLYRIADSVYHNAPCC